MKCCICETKLDQYNSNNPYPLCNRDDYESRCCDACNELVITARIGMARKEKRPIAVGDTLIIFHSVNSTKPTEQIRDTGKFLAGYVDEIIEGKDGKPTTYKGTWGNFEVSDDDSITNL